MIIWIASYPRSGNTFFRVALHRLYGVPTHVVYDVDGVAERIGSELMGARDRPADIRTMRRAFALISNRETVQPSRRSPTCRSSTDDSSAAVRPENSASMDLLGYAR